LQCVRGQKNEQCTRRHGLTRETINQFQWEDWRCIRIIAHIKGARRQSAEMIRPISIVYTRARLRVYHRRTTDSKLINKNTKQNRLYVQTPTKNTKKRGGSM